MDRHESVPIWTVALAATLVASVAGVPLVSADHPYDYPVRPGLPILVGQSGGCTLGFIFQSTTNDTLYGTTAGHCVDGATSHIVSNRNHHTIGRIVAWRYFDGQDWALIRFDSEVVDRVRPDVLRWTGPVGPLDGEVIETEDVVCHYGGSIYHGIFMADRCGRHSSFIRYTDAGVAVDWFNMYGMSWGGDSGSPVLHYKTGQAIGMINGGLGGPYDYKGGMTVCGIVNAASQAGYDLKLATAPYAPPPQAPSIPGPATVTEFIFPSEASGDCT